MNIAIVGNGASVLNKHNGEFIDCCDRVVRINKFIIEGYEKHVGSTLDIYCSKWHKIEHRDQHFINKHSEFWFPHPAPPTRWGSLGGVDPIDDAVHEENKARFNIHDNQIKFLSTKDRQYLDEHFNDTTPSVGMIAIAMTMCLFPHADVHITGMDGMMNGWYWDQSHDCMENCRNSLIKEKIFYRKMLNKSNIHEL